MTGQVESGKQISSNTDASGRFHTDWLNMMYPRLKLSRGLLRNDGVVFCSIDDIEAPRLRALMDEVFGEENFLAQFSWRTDGNFDNQAKVKVLHEYIVMYAKSIDDFPHPPVVDPSVPANSKLFLPQIRNTVVKNGPKNPISAVTLPIGFPADFQAGIIEKRDDAWPHYSNDAVISNWKLEAEVVVRSGWSSRELLLEFIKGGHQPIVDGKGQETTFLISRTGAIEVVKRRTDYQSHVISVLNGFGGPQKASAELSEMGGHFSGYPKPVSLIRYLVAMAYGTEGIVLDFFAGSGPTAQAVLEANDADTGSRRYILVQLPEPFDSAKDSQKAAVEFCDRLCLPRNIAELTKVRLRLVSQRAKSKAPESQRDMGFKVFRLDRSNIRAWSPVPHDLQSSVEEHVQHLLPDRSDEDVLYELLLKLGLDLAVPFESRKIGTKLVHCIGAGTVMICLEEGLDREAAESLAEGIADWQKSLAPAGATKLVFKDSAFSDDVAKTNLAAILAQHGLTDVRSI